MSIEWVAPLYNWTSTSAPDFCRESPYLIASGASKSHSATARNVLGLFCSTSIGAKHGDASQFRVSSPERKYMFRYQVIREGVSHGEYLDVAHIVSTVAVLSITGQMSI
jgi:hypothetical protein